MPTSSPSLRIAVMGAGNIGSLFAYQFARVGGHDVTVVARAGSARLTQLQRDAAVVKVNGDRANVHVSDALDEATAYDLVIVTLLAHQVNAVLPALKRSAAQCVQYMFNTFEPERLEQALGSERCAFGMPFVQARLDKDGKLQATIGAGGQKTLMSQQRWVDVFNASGLPAAIEPNMTLWLRCHVPLCVAFESVSVAGVARTSGASWQEARTIARGIHASFRLIEALGYPIYPRSKRLIDRCPLWIVAAMLWSLSRVRSFRDLLATGKAECVALIDTLVAAAPPAEPPAVALAIRAMKLW